MRSNKRSSCKTYCPPIAGIDTTKYETNLYWVDYCPPIAGIDTYQTHRQDSHRPIAPHCGD